MKPEIFLDLNTNCFCSTIFHFCQQNKLQAKNLTLLDSAPGQTANLGEEHLSVLMLFIFFKFYSAASLVIFCIINKQIVLWRWHIFMCLCCLHTIKHHFTLWTTGPGINNNFKAYYLQLDFLETVRVLDMSHKTIKDYWGSSDILKGINNINIAWEVVSVKCLKGVRRKHLPQFMYNFTGF